MQGTSQGWRESDIAKPRVMYQVMRAGEEDGKDPLPEEAQTAAAKPDNYSKRLGINYSACAITVNRGLMGQAGLINGKHYTVGISSSQRGI